MSHPIAYITHTIYSKRDINGNVYAIAKVVRCSDGHTVIVDRHWGSNSNLPQAVWRLADVACGGTVYDIEERNITKREQANIMKRWRNAEHIEIREPCGDLSDLMQAFAQQMMV